MMIKPSMRIVAAAAAATVAPSLWLGGGQKGAFNHYGVVDAAPHGCIVKPQKGLKPIQSKDDGTHVKSFEMTLDTSDFNLNSCFAQQQGAIMERASSSTVDSGRGSSSPNKKAKIDLQLLPDERSLEFEIEERVLLQGNNNEGSSNHKIITGKMVGLTPKEEEVGELNVLLDVNGQIEAGSIHTQDAIYHLSRQEDGTTIKTTKIFLKDLPQDDPQELRHSKELKREASELDVQDVQRTRNRNLRRKTPSGILPSPSIAETEPFENEEARSLLVDSTTTDTPVDQATRITTTTVNSYFDQSALLEGITEGWIIDVMVPYTQRTMCAIAQAGSPNNCLWNERRHEMVLRRIELAIAEANVAFINSGIPGRVRLVHTFMIESSDFDDDRMSYADILRALAYPTDGKMDNVTPLRDYYGADIVSLFVDNQSSCGLAYTGTPVSKSWTFSVVNWVCATGYYSLVHEIGHHLGGRHDRRVEGCTGASNTQCCADLGGCDRYGYLDSLNRYRSIMSYSCPVDGGCPRVQVFSQPNYPYITPIGRQLPIGDVYHNNAKSMTSVFREVSAYRERFVPKITEAPAPAPTHCGNGICEGNLGENCRTCPEDCIVGRYKASECGNGICEATEDCLSCSKDCGGRLDVTNDAHKYCCVGGPKNLVASQNINFGISCDDHPYDYCLFNSECSLEPEASSTTFCCGNGVCELGEGMWNCGTDCQCNNNNICDFWEDTSCKDCQGLNDIQDSMFTTNCMANGRNCVGIVPDPCCGTCNTNKRVCE